MVTKEGILDAMYRVFARRGYAASMADLAKEVGLRPASLYSHFISKDQIVILTAQREIQSYYRCLADNLSATATKASCLESLGQLFCFTVGFFLDRERLHFWQHLLAIPDNDVQQRCRAQLRLGEGLFAPAIADIIIGAIDQGDVRPELADSLQPSFNVMLLGILENLLIFDWSEAEAQGRAQACWNIFVRGVAPERGKS